MVTISDFAVRTRSDNSQFFCLILQGGIELVKSKQTERFYATVKKASIPSTFDEATCKASIGSQFPGSIQKQSCPEYSFTVKDTGEVLLLNYRWEYVPEGASLAEAIFDGAVEGADSMSLSRNQLFAR